MMMISVRAMELEPHTHSFGTLMFRSRICLPYTPFVIVGLLVAGFSIS